MPNFIAIRVPYRNVKGYRVFLEICRGRVYLEVSENAKMRSIAFTFLLLVCSLVSIAQAKSDLVRQKLKGRVKTITELEYDAKKGDLRTKAVTNYSDSGNQIGFTTYSPDGVLLSKAAFIYDSGALKEENRYKADGSLMVKITRKYDEKGNIVEEQNFDGGGTMFLKVIPRYDPKGNRKVKDSYNEYGILFLKANYKFDEKGNEKEMKEYDSHHSLSFTTTFSYDKFDSQGNWLERTTYKDDVATSRTEREISFY
jgi:hypothetical protein